MLSNGNISSVAHLVSGMHITQTKTIVKQGKENNFQVSNNNSSHNTQGKSSMRICIQICTANSRSLHTLL